MLASLLPGIRELRAPLAAGYLWFVAAWVSLGDRLPDADKATGFIDRLYDLGQAAGAPTVTVGLSFAAYLVGSLSETVTTRALWVASRDRRDIAVPLTDRGKEALRDALVDGVLTRVADREVADGLAEQPGGRDLVLLTGSHMPDHLRRQVVRDRLRAADVANVMNDLVLLPTRLLGTELHGLYDRLRAEAEFKAAVSVPLAAGLVLLSQEHSRWWLASLPLAAALFIQGRRDLQAAGDVLAVAVRARSEGVESPALAEVVDRQLTDLRDLSNGHPSPAVAEANPFVAYHLLSRAEARGDPELRAEAKEWLGRTARNWATEREVDRRAEVYRYAQILLEDGEIEDAMSWLERLADAGHIGARFDLARLLLDANEPEAAEEQLRAVMLLEHTAVAGRAPDLHLALVGTQGRRALHEVAGLYEGRGEHERAEQLRAEAGTDEVVSET